MPTFPKSILRLVSIALVAGVTAAILVFLWMSGQADSFRTTATLVALDDIRTPQESVQYLADLDGALHAQPVIQRISIDTGVNESVLDEGLNVNRLGSSSTVRLTYESASDDASLAEAVIKSAAVHTNDYLNRSRDNTLQSDVANANQALKSATAQLRNARAAVDDFAAANGERDIGPLALVEERLAADLRVQIVSATAAVDSAQREADRLRIAADASPTNLEVEAAARAAEALLTDNTAVADALQVELDLAQSSLEAFSTLAREQNELQEDFDRARTRFDEATAVADEAEFVYSSRGQSFTTEFSGGTVLVTRTTDAARRSLMAGVSVAALIGLASLWWKTAVSPTPPDPRRTQTSRIEIAALPEALPQATGPIAEIPARSLPHPDDPHIGMPPADPEA